MVQFHSIMSDESKPMEVLEGEITAISDTHTNVVGLVQKLAASQLTLSEAGFESFAKQVGDAFAALSMTADTLQSAMHDAELERNRIRNEA